MSTTAAFPRTEAGKRLLVELGNVPSGPRQWLEEALTEVEQEARAQVESRLRERIEALPFWDAGASDGQKAGFDVVNRHAVLEALEGSSPPSRPPEGEFLGFFTDQMRDFKEAAEPQVDWREGRQP
jgi:hypothetical protein